MEILYVYLISAAICWLYARFDNGSFDGKDMFVVICPIFNSIAAIFSILDIVLSVIPNFKFWKKVPYWFFFKKYPSKEE